MGCICRQKTALLACTNCQTRTTVVYERGQDPIAIAAAEGKKCRKCKQTNFELRRL